MSPVVELLPGVLVNRAVDGQVWLGVPLGTDAFVQSELKRQLEEHDKRQLGIAAYATCNGDAVGHAGVRLSRQLSIAAVKYSANGRDVHFLRSLGKRAVGEAAALHDNAVDHTLAVVLGQAAQPKGDEQPMCYRTPERASAAYRESLPWLRLPGIAVGVRPWARYGDAAHVGMWAQAYNSGGSTGAPRENFHVILSHHKRHQHKPRPARFLVVHREAGKLRRKVAATLFFKVFDPGGLLCTTAAVSASRFVM